ncbi:MAG TPA: LysM domain-containing protein [Nitriliruptorales bacterium]|nr:LysM domain-containing protein [Nitriliruptorales bacterium]
MTGATMRLGVTVDAGALGRSAWDDATPTERRAPPRSGAGNRRAMRAAAVRSCTAARRAVAVVEDGPARPARLEPAAVRSRTATRRRLAVWAICVLAVLLVAAGRVGARADLDRPLIGGTVTVVPGDTLWEVAVANAPEGTDPRDYLARLRALNGLRGAEVSPWTVVLLPSPDEPVR